MGRHRTLDEKIADAKRIRESLKQRNAGKTFIKNGVHMGAKYAKEKKALREAPVEIPSEGIMLSGLLESPSVFAKEVLKVELSEQQEEFMLAVKRIVDAKTKASLGKELTPQEVKYARKLGISIRSGRGCGKDAALAIVIIWALLALPHLKGMATAPGENQLKDILWPEMAKWIRIGKENSELGKSLLALLSYKSEKVAIKGAEEDWFLTRRTAKLSGSPEEQAETLSGRHADHLILIVDEASAVPDPVFIPIEGTMTGKMNFAILISNPTKPQGFFFQTHNADSARWVSLHWNAEDSPLVNKELLKTLKEKYGEDSPYYQVYVKGNFASTAANVLIPLHLVLDAVERDLLPGPGAPLVVGVDVAYLGDDKSIILSRRENKVEEITEYRKIDTMALAGWVSLFIRENEPAAVAVDVIGYGAGVYDRLREQGYESVIALNVAESPSDETKYRNLRSELWWKLRDRFEKRMISIPRDEELIAELSSIRLDDPEDGKLRVMTKKKMRQLYKVQSPNRADALMMTEYFASPSYAPAGLEDEIEREERRQDKRLGRMEVEDELAWMVA